MVAGRSRSLTAVDCLTECGSSGHKHMGAIANDKQSRRTRLSNSEWLTNTKETIVTSMMSVVDGSAKSHHQPPSRHASNPKRALMLYQHKAHTHVGTICSVCLRDVRLQHCKEVLPRHACSPRQFHERSPKFQRDGVHSLLCIFVLLFSVVGC